jgi:hypothetical protein
VTDYWTAGGSYLWKVKDIMTIRDQTLYAGIRLETGQVFGRLIGNGTILERGVFR